MSKSLHFIQFLSQAVQRWCSFLHLECRTYIKHFFFWIAKKFKYLNTVVLKYILINWRKSLCLCCQNATLWPGVCVIYLTVTPSFSRTRVPFSWYSSLVIQKLSLSFMMSASTAPPKNTMCLRRGGSSMRILNFYKSRSEDTFSKTAMHDIITNKTQN